MHIQQFFLPVVRLYFTYEELKRNMLVASYLGEESLYFTYEELKLCPLLHGRLLLLSLYFTYEELKQVKGKNE